MCAVFLGKIKGRFPIPRFHIHVGSGAQEQLEAFGLVVEGAVVDGRVAVNGGSLQIGRVLHQKVDNVQRMASLLPDGHVQGRFASVLKETHSKRDFQIKVAGLLCK